MRMTADDSKITVEIDKWQDSVDMTGESIGKISNIVGVIDGDDCGFASVIDLMYKDSVQYSEMFLKTYHSKEQFRELCKKLDIDCFEYMVCNKCDKPIYGACTWKSGPIHFECDKHD